MGMLPFLIAGLAAGAVLLVTVGIAMTGSGGVASRLERYTPAGGAATSEPAAGAVRVHGHRLRRWADLPRLPQRGRAGGHLPDRGLFPAGVPWLPTAQAPGRIQPATARYDHPAGQLAARRLLVPPGSRVGVARGPSPDLRRVRARRPRDEPRDRPPAGVEQPGPARRVGGPRA